MGYGWLLFFITMDLSISLNLFFYGVRESIRFIWLLVLQWQSLLVLSYKADKSYHLCLFLEVGRFAFMLIPENFQHI